MFKNLKTQAFQKSNEKYARRNFRKNYQNGATDFFKKTWKPPLKGPKLYELEQMTSLVKNKINFERTLFVGCQHFLESTESLFACLVKLGAKPENMHFVGKWYSTSKQVENRLLKAGIKIPPFEPPKFLGNFQAELVEKVKYLWESAHNDFLRKKHYISGIIILDDGGTVLEHVPKELRFMNTIPIVGIEQTHGGLYNHALTNLTFPIIEVATSAAKKHLESKYIAEAIIRRLESLLKKKGAKLGKTIFGVIGQGAIGNQITQYLLKRNYVVIIHDSEEFPSTTLTHKNLIRVSNKKQVFANARIILGCTGQDITADIDVLKELQGDTTLISCGSGDKEFNQLLKKINQHSYSLNMETLHIEFEYDHQNKSILTIANRGFPLNFDRSPISVPSDKIALTRTLLLGACIQAKILMHDNNTPNPAFKERTKHMLDPHIQHYATMHWSYIKDVDTQLKNCFLDLEWIVGNSGGYYSKNPKLDQLFNSEIEEKRTIKSFLPTC